MNGVLDLGLPLTKLKCIFHNHPSTHYVDNDVHLPCFLGGRAWGSQVVKLPGGPRVPKEVKMGALPATHRLIDERIRHHVAHMMSYDPKSRPTSCEVVEIMRKIQ